MSDLMEDVVSRIDAEKLDKRQLRNFITKLLPKVWGARDFDWQLEQPEINTVATATFGSGTVVTFMENGRRMVVLGVAGEHYVEKKLIKPGEVAYAIPGGFVNLRKTEGSSFVPKSDKPESGFTAAARETEEEFRYPNKKPVLTVDPKRLRPMDTDTLVMSWGGANIVMGFMLELAKQEVTKIKRHVARLARSPAYKAAVATNTCNADTGKPEFSTVVILPLDEVAAGKHCLLHKDQLSLFQAVEQYFKEIEEAFPDSERVKGPVSRFFAKLGL